MSTVSSPVFVDPVSVVSKLSVAPGSQVADFGCGSGFFSFEFARQVGIEGRVHAFDVLPQALEAVNSQAKSLGLGNIITKRVNLENEHGSGLSPASMDWVILKDVLLQNKKKEVLLREVAAVLKPGGRALIMEWNPDESLVGPEKSLRIDKKQLQDLILQAGLSIDEELPVGGFHYAYIAKK
ncbi:MAG: methyltransferase domain-containing protein [Candidatus Moranbacteria bacterium]|nr:methyltransferase domain-containing protein [Candidatus Moranbacteria bacterium]